MSRPPPPHPDALRGLWRRRAGWFALSALLGSLTLLASLGLLALSGHFITATALAGASAAGVAAFDIFRPGAVIRFFAIVRTAGRYGERLVSHEAVLRLLADLRREGFARLARLAPEPLARHSDGDLLQRLVADIDTLDEAPLRVWLPWLWAGLIVMATSALVAWANPTLVTVATPWLLAALLGVPLWLSHGATRQARQLATQAATQRGALVDALRGLTTLRLSGAWPARRAEWMIRDHALLRTRLDQRLREAVGQAITVALVGTATWHLAARGRDLVLDQRIAPPWLVLALLATLGTLEALAPIAGAMLARARAQAAAQRLGEMYALEPAVRYPESGVDPTGDSGASLTFDQVRFRYPGRSAGLAVDSLHLPAGARVVVQGPSGAGKSTFAALAARIFDPDQGRVLLDGTDLRTIDETALRQRIALMPQRPHLFSMTLAENLRLAAPQADDARLRAALDAVALGAWLDTLPQGLATPIGEYGRGLSGGEARRVALAQTLLRGAALMLLDEPFEGLDPTTRTRVVAGIDTFAESATLIVVTHRAIDFGTATQHLRVVEGHLSRQ